MLDNSNILNQLKLHLPGKKYFIAGQNFLLLSTMQKGNNKMERYLNWSRLWEFKKCNAAISPTTFTFRNEAHLYGTCGRRPRDSRAYLLQRTDQSLTPPTPPSDRQLYRLKIRPQHPSFLSQYNSVQESENFSFNQT